MRKNGYSKSILKRLLETYSENLLKLFFLLKYSFKLSLLSFLLWIISISQNEFSILPPLEILYIFKLLIESFEGFSFHFWFSLYKKKSSYILRSTMNNAAIHAKSTSFESHLCIGAFLTNKLINWNPSFCEKSITVFF